MRVPAGNLLESTQAQSQAKSASSKTCFEITQLMTATKAAEFGSRPPLIATLANISLTKARAIFRDVTGHDPIKGQMPSDINFYLGSVNRHFESVWLVQAYKSLARNDDDLSRQNECLFTVYEQYLLHFEKPSVSFDRFFYLIRHTFFGDEIRLQRCRDCGCGKLTVKSWDPTRVIKCPVCHLTT